MTPPGSRVFHAPAIIRSWLDRWHARRESPATVPVIVYQMAKVGSSAVVAALQQAGIPALHVHRMDADHLCSMRQARAFLGWQVPPVPAHDLLGLELRRDVIAPGHRADIITLVRDPI